MAKSDRQYGLNTYTDTATGKTYYIGTDEEVTSHLDEASKERLLAQLAPRQAGIVGNLADLQRIGAALVTESGDSVADAVEPPPDRTADQIEADRNKAEKIEGALDEAVASVNDAESDSGSKSKSSKSSKG